MTSQPPVWRDAANTTSFRSYGGSDALLRIEGEQLRLVVRSSKSFVAIFGALFLPTFAISAWFLIPDEPARLLFTFGGTAVGLVYWLMDYNQRLGDYLIIDRRAQSLKLPRCKVAFPLDQVFCLQMIRGRSKRSAEVESDLNLLVAEGNDLIRYHVLGSPSRGQIEQVARFSGLRVDELDLGGSSFRDADCQSRAAH